MRRFVELIAVVFLLAARTSLAMADEPAANPPSKLPDFRLPPGFTVEQVAGPPLVHYPLFATFDERGRLFVAEGTGVNLPGPELREKKLGRITRLEDSDGDGRFDSSTVFADGLVFPQGVLCHRGAVYVASHPSIWRLEDPDGKGVATRRTELIAGFGFNGNGCDIHGPFAGPDGRLYWTDGRHGYKIRTKAGELLEGLAARIWRSRFDGTEVERLCGGGFDNPVELDFTPEGEAIGTMDQAPGDCLLHYVEGGVYPMEHPCLNEFTVTGSPLGAVKQYSPVLPAALCGFARYRSATFGLEFQNCFLSTQYMLHKIVRHQLVREGSTYHAIDSDFLTCTTHDVRITDVLEDADGSLLFVDMGAWFTYGFPGNPTPKPQALGAIYRIRRTADNRVVDPRGRALQIELKSPHEAIGLLGDRRPAVREQAIERLANLGVHVVPALNAVLKPGAQPLSSIRRDAVWALCRIEGSGARAAIRSALSDSDVSVRIAATHAAGLWRDVDGLGDLMTLVTSASLPERRAAAEALGRIGRSEAVPALLKSMRSATDRFLEHSVIYAIIRINDRSATLTAIGDIDSKVRRAGLIALDQMKDGGLTQGQVAAVLNSSDPDLQRAAFEMVSRRPAWAKLVRDPLTSWLSGPLSAAQERLLADALPTIGGEPELVEVLAKAMVHPATSESARALLIRSVADSRLDVLPVPWVEALRALLASKSPSALATTISAIKARGLTCFDGVLRKLSQNPGIVTDIRIAALECLAGRAGSPDPGAFKLLADRLSEDAPPMERLAAARVLGKGPVTNEQLIQLAGTLSKASPIVLRQLLPAYTRSSDMAVGIALVRSLESSPATNSLTFSELEIALKSFPSEVRIRAQRLRDGLESRQKDKAEHLAQLSAEIAKLKGDSDAGQELFLSTKLGCFGCHRAVGRGGTVGPDLSRIGAIRSPAELLESIVYPGATVAPEFRTVVVAMHDGRVASGLLMRESPESITLKEADLSEVHIRRADVEAISPTTGSLMPDGLETIITRQELRDLLEFLTQQR